VTYIPDVVFMVKVNIYWQSMICFYYTLITHYQAVMLFCHTFLDTLTK